MTRKDEVAIYGKVLVECVSQRLCDVSFLMNCMILMFPLFWNTEDTNHGQEAAVHD